MQMETRLSLKFICPNTSQANSCRRSGEFVSKGVHVCVVSTRLVTQCFSLQECAQHRAALGLSITLRTNAHF